MLEIHWPRLVGECKHGKQHERRMMSIPFADMMFNPSLQFQDLHHYNGRRLFGYSI